MTLSLNLKKKVILHSFNLFGRVYFLKCRIKTYIFFKFLARSLKDYAAMEHHVFPCGTQIRYPKIQVLWYFLRYPKTGFCQGNRLINFLHNLSVSMHQIWKMVFFYHWSKKIYMLRYEWLYFYFFKITILSIHVAMSDINELSKSQLVQNYISITKQNSN